MAESEEKFVAEGVREYAEEYPVVICQIEEDDATDQRIGRGRWVVMAENESRHNFTQVDLLELLEFLSKRETRSQIPEIDRFSRE